MIFSLCHTFCRDLMINLVINLVVIKTKILIYGQPRNRLSILDEPRVRGKVILFTRLNLLEMEGLWNFHDGKTI